MINQRGVTLVITAFFNLYRYSRLKRNHCTQLKYIKIDS